MTFFGRAVHSSLSKRARLPQRRTLFLEPLEDRRLLATFNVNSFLDTVDANPGDGVASDGANTTLRAAIMEANALPGPDTINLPAGTYNLTIAGRSEDAAAQGDLDVTGDLQILGAGAGATIIDGKQLDRVFDIRTSSTNNVTIELRDLTITGGDARALSGGGSLEDHGGGIRTDFYAFVTIANSVLSNNAAIRSPDPSVSYGVGAAIASSARVLTIEDSQIIGNTSSNSGGGLYFSGTVGGQPGTAIIRGSTFADNRAVSGGAIFNHGIIQIENSTLSNNTARHSSGTVGGGGAINNNNGGDVTLTNTTLSGNDALSGGAIINFDRVTALNSTIAGNSASTRGGGIYQSSSSSATQSLSVRNTIIANNTASSAGPDISERSAGTITSLGNNLIGNTSDSGGFGIASDLLNVNPLLGPLAANGGVTQTHELLSGSPAIDSANVVAAPSTDQRLVARPQGAADDIGAFETTNNLAYLDLSINPSSVVEDQGAGAATGTLTRGGDLSRPLTVFLTSSDETEATAPVSVTIAANATSATFPITAIDDAIVDGTKTVTFTARDSSGPPAFDPTFGTGGLAPAGIEQNDSFNDLDLIVQPDGKLLTLGDDSDPTNAWRVARRNADGSADTTFWVGRGGCHVVR